jgi:hypothetical protein
MKTKLVALLLAMSATTTVNAQQWEDIKVADNGSFYTAVKSMSRPDNEIAVYANPSNDCTIVLNVFDFFWNNSKAAALNGRRAVAHAQYKIDSNTSWDAKDTAHTVDHYSDSDLTVLKFETVVPLNFINEMMFGSKLIFRVKMENSEWGETIRYPLTGSRNKLDKLMTTCHNAMPKNEWSDDDEWTS